MIEKKSAKDYFEEGNKNLDIGNYEKAIENYDKAIKLDPKYKEAYFNRAILYDGREEYDDALKDYDEAIDIDPDFKEAYYNKSCVYIKLAKYEKAFKNCSKVIDIDPHFKEVYYIRGILYGKFNKYQEALKDFSKYIDLDTEYKIKKLNELSKIKYINSPKEIKEIENILKNSLGEKWEEILKDINNKRIIDKPVNKIEFGDDLYDFIYEILFNKTYQNNLDKDEKLALIELIFKCDDLMHLFIVKENEKGKFVHYTKAKNLKFLLKKEKDLKKDEEGNLIFPKMRLNNAVYMNDPEEGKIFNNLYINDNIKNIINSHNENYTYLTCFCPKKEKDELPMWVHYADSGSGIGIVFNEKFFENTNLYRVQYLDAKNFNVAKISELKEIIDILSEDIFKYNKKTIFLELTNIILNYISYLFKDKAYSYEKEVRIIKLRDYDNAKINEDFDVPRLYIDFEKRIDVNMIDEIIVGPKGNYEEIYAYAKYLGIKKITKSNIKYR